MTGREAMGVRSIREALVEYNALSDGPCGVALMWNESGEVRVASVVCADSFGLEPVVDIPGDDRPFPVKAFTAALACSTVAEWPYK